MHPCFDCSSAGSWIELGFPSFAGSGFQWIRCCLDWFQHCWSCYVIAACLILWGWLRFEGMSFIQSWILMIRLIFAGWRWLWYFQHLLVDRWSNLMSFANCFFITGRILGTSRYLCLILVTLRASVEPCIFFTDACCFDCSSCPSNQLENDPSCLWPRSYF